MSSDLRTGVAKRSFISWGLGQQSTVLVVLAIQAKIKVDGIIFCDTGEEMPDSYKALEYYTPLIEKAGIPLIILDRGYSLYDHFFEKHQVPLGWVNPYCSSHFKRDLINAYHREQFGVNGRLYTKNIEIIEYMGITTDEIQRVKPAAESWKTKNYWFIDNNWSRQDCINYLRDNNYMIPVKSGCWLCPNKSKQYFKDMQYENEEGFQKLVVLEENAKQFNPDNPPTLKGFPLNKLVKSANIDNWFEPDLCEDVCFT